MMKKYLWGVWGVVALSAFSLNVWAEGWEHEHEEQQQRYVQTVPVHSVMQGKKNYRKECSACHMAYPANFLPARSWKALLAHLDDHFDENAELEAGDVQVIGAYLNANASDHIVL